MANGVLGGGCVGVVRTDGAGVRGVPAVGSAVGAGCIGRSRVKGVGTDLAMPPVNTTLTSLMYMVILISWL